MKHNKLRHFMVLCEIVGKYILAFIFGVGSALFIVWFIMTTISNYQESTKEFHREPQIIETPNIIVIVPERSEIVSVEQEELSSDTVVDDEELYLMAHLIFAEAGSDWCSDKMQLYVGSVVLNRIAHHKYPDSMKKVIYQSGQYSCTWDGNFEKEPNQRAWNNAKLLLTEGSKLPANVLFQAQFKQGDGVYEKVQNMYFCYIED